MENYKEKILLLPAINIKKGVSRSFYFAKELSKYYEVYVTEWDDPQNVEFDSKQKGGIFNTLKCFFKSLFTKTKIYKDNNYNYYIVKSSKMTLLVIHRVLGIVLSLKLIRLYNSIVLRTLLKRIKPTILFYADGCDMYPVIKENRIVITDIQDDFSKGNFRDNDYQRRYGKKNYNISDKNYIVSKSAKKKLSKFYDADFEYIPNGADFNGLRAISKEDTDKLRKNLGLNNKLVVSFIGGSLWLDTTFSKSLFEETFKLLPDVHFLLIGNHDQIKDSENVTNLGRMNNEDTYRYYNLSDVGIFLKDSKGSSFLENSVPLKIIQYSAVNKYVITPYISWLAEESFNNVFMIADFSVTNVVSALRKIKNNKEILDYDDKWDEYSWSKINKRLVQFITNKRKEMINLQ